MERFKNKIGFIFSDKMTKVEPPQRERYDGLLVHYLRGDRGKPIVFIAKGLGIPGKELGWMYTLNGFGLNVAHAPYRGTWGSEGEFLSEVDGELSVTKDISDAVDSALRIFSSSNPKFGPNKVYIVADCFGCSPSLVASTRFDEVSKIFIYGGMIYTDNPELNDKYKRNNDKSDKLGEELAKSQKEGGRLFDGYKGFDLNVWNRMINGKTGLNPYLYFPELTKKQIFAVHAEGDNLIHYERTTDFIKALNEYSSTNGLKHAKLSIVPGKKGHRSGFGTWEEVMVMQFLTDKKLITLLPDLIKIQKLVKEHKRGVQRPDGTWFGVPFYDIVVNQVREFQQEGLLKDKPLEEILCAIF